MNHQSNAGDATHMPSWWMSIMKNMVISSQKAQDVEPDGEPCALGIESKQSESPANEDVPGGATEQAAINEENEEDAAENDSQEEPCGFMCKLKKGLSKAKELDDKTGGKLGDAITAETIDKKSEDKAALSEEMDHASLIRSTKEQASNVV